MVVNWLLQKTVLHEAVSLSLRLSNPELAEAQLRIERAQRMEFEPLVASCRSSSAMRPAAKSGRPDFFGFSNRIVMAPLSIVSHDDGHDRWSVYSFHMRS